MKVLTLYRWANDKCGTFGTIHADYPLWVTLERPWLDNRHGESCIPKGEYVCRRFSSEKHPNTWEVTNVPNRDGILFHVGNTYTDSQGCILVGKKLMMLNGIPAIGDSGTGFKEFQDYLHDETEFKLVIA